MTRQLETVIKTVRELPDTRQDELAELLTQAIHPSVKYTPEQLEAIDEGLAQANAGQFATERQVQNLFARFSTV